MMRLSKQSHVSGAKTRQKEKLTPAQTHKHLNSVSASFSALLESLRIAGSTIFSKLTNSFLWVHQNTEHSEARS